MTKRIIALLLALILTVGLLPTVALADAPAADTNVVSGSIGKDGKWTTATPDQSNMPEGVETVSKTAKPTSNLNEYEVELKVVLKKTSETKTGAAATALVLDCSGSMKWCTECGKEYCNHTTGVTYNPTYTVNDDYYYYVKNDNEYVSVEYCDGKHGRSSCTGGAGWYTESGRKDHTPEKKFTPMTSADDAEITHTQFYTRTGGSSDTSRMTAAKNAAKNFLKTYSGFDASVINDNGTLKPEAKDLSIKRYVAVIRFSNNIDNYTDSSWWESEDYKPAWYDVSTVVGYNKVLATINNASAGGGTNLDAGLTTANNLMDADLVKNLTSKNVIALTDGAPTYSKSYGDGGSTNKDICDETARTAATLRKKSKVYTVCFAAESDTLYNGGGTVGDFLKKHIATQPAEGTTEQYAYNAKSADDLIKVFKDITDTIVSGLNTGTVKDTLPAGITSAAFGESNVKEWKLNEKPFTKNETTNTVDGKQVTTYTYTYTYTVTIDPDDENLVKTEDGYAPLNGETTLTVEVDGKKETIPFPIPAGKVTPTTFTVTWKSQDDKTELEKDENVAKNSKPSYDGATPTKAEDDMYTYTFAGWATEPNKEAGTLEDNLPNVTADVTYYAAFSKQLKQYTVTGTIDNGTVNNKASTDTQTVNAGGSSAAMTFTPAAGYEIKTITEKIGDGQPTPITFTDKNSYTYPAKDNVKANITVDVKTAKRSDLKYVVKHVEKGNETNVLETENKTGTLDEVINGEAQKKTFTGFTYDDCSPASITISANEDNNVITLYYTRNKYKVTYTYTGSVPQGLQPPTETEYDFGASVTIANAPDAVPGYTFEGWKRGTEDATNFSMPAENVTITGNWTKNADAGYTIEYYLETLTEGTFEKDNNRTISDRTGTIGTAASVTEADKKPITGFTFDANNTNNKLEGEIVSGDLLTLKLYYKRNSYKVTYQYTGTVTPEDATKLPDEVTYKYGAEVIVAAAATSADYIFSGWSRTGKFNMPAENVIITGSWTLKEPTAVNVDLNNHIYKTFTSDTADIPNGKLTFNVTVSGKSDNAASMTRSGSVEFTKQDVQDETTSKAFTFASDPLTFTAAGEYTFEVVESTTPVINGLTYNVNNEAHLFTIVVDKKENANELYVKEIRVGTEEYTGVDLTDTLAYATITNNYIEPKKTFDLNNTIFKTFTPVAGGLPIPTGEGISYTFTARMTEQTEEGVADGNTGRNYTLKATLTGEVTEANKVPFKVEGASEVSFAPGTYYFLVREDSSATVTGTVNGTIHNDSQAYLLTLNVKEDLSFETEVQETAVAMSLEESTPGLGTITFNNTYEEKEPGKCTIDFSDFVKKELTATGSKTASDVNFTVNVKESPIPVINSTQGVEAVSTYAGELLSTTLNAHFDSITGGETKTTPFTGSVEITSAGQYIFELREEDGQRTGVTYDETIYTLYVQVQEKEGSLAVTHWYFTDSNRVEHNAGEKAAFHNTIDTGKDDYYPIIIPTIINKDTGMLNKTDHFAYVIGYPDGTVHPNGQITRAEVATIFFRLLRDEVRDGAFTTSNTYSDVAYGKWYNNPISTMSALGIITGYPDGTFKPNKPITRAEFAAIAARFDETQSGKSATFSDVIGHWAAKEIGIAYYNDWIKGYPDGTFKPDQNITRAEAMTLINRVLERKPESPADLLTNMNKWTDNLDTSKWYYLDVQEATNSHGYTRKTFNYELWRQMLPDPDWSRYER